ncbi:hypothetical protein TB1_013993 [Malus domestica]
MPKIIPTVILDKSGLKGQRFLAWYRHIENVSKVKDILYVLKQSPPHVPPTKLASKEECQNYVRHYEDDLQAKCLILTSLSEELMKLHKHMDTSCAMVESLHKMHDIETSNVRFSNVCSLMNAKMAKGASVHKHGQKMEKIFKDLKSLGISIDGKMAQDFFLASLSDDFTKFIVNYKVNRFDHSLKEMIDMCCRFEKGFKMDSGSENANIRKMLHKKKAKKSKGTCFHCGNDERWKKKYRMRIASLMTRTFEETISVIESAFTVSSNSWIFDSGASQHICNTMQGLVGSKSLSNGEMIVRVGNGTKISAKAIGTYMLNLPSGEVLELKNCLYFPSCIKNLISISKLLRDGHSVLFDKMSCTLYLNGRIISHGNMIEGLFHLETNSGLHCIESGNTSKPKRAREDVNQEKTWHLKLGHVNLDKIRKMSKDGYIHPLGNDRMGTCECCLKGKMTKSPFTGKGERTTEILGLIHTDVCGPMSTTSRGGFSYYITFTDDHSRFGYVYLMKYKSESFEKFKEFKNEVEKQTGKQIKILRSDRGGEYLSNEFLDYLKECGIISQWTPPGTPQLNGVSERRNRTLMNMVRSMMSSADLPVTFWGYALYTADYLLNRVPSKSVPQTPYEIWHGRKPSLKHVKIWGCEAYVKKLEATKLEARSVRCYFVGYPKETMGYEFYHPDDQKVFVARTAKFLEDEFVLKGTISKQMEINEINNEPQTSTRHIDNPVPEPLAPRRSERVSEPPKRYGLDNDFDELYLLGDNETKEDPRDYTEAMSDIDSKRWQEAMKSEMDSMYQNQVWTLVDPPEGIVPVGNKWVFKRKIGVDGNVETYKARLVAKGYRQREGIDYEETFSPVAMIKSIRILLAIAAYHDYEIWQMDVKTAFLNGYLEEELYMTQPEGFMSKSEKTKVCKLQRSIYGLKQASRSWNIRFDTEIKTFGFTQNEDDNCVYQKVVGDAVVFLVLYVDDILLFGNDTAVLSSVKVWLSKTFHMKDLGDASYVLGIKLYRDRSRKLIGLSQSMYIDKVLSRFEMEQSKKGFLPVRHGIHLSKTMEPKTPEEIGHMSRIPYASAIGSLMYAMICTRPDIAYAVSITSRYQSNPGSEHWTAVKTVLKYLRRTKDMFLVYGGASELQVEGYTDADFQSDVDDRSSNSGYVFTLNGGAVSWKSKKQSVIADSTTEAEYVAAAEAGKEAFWMKKFITELGVVPTITSPVTLYCDNSGAIAQAKEPRAHQKNKHIDRRFNIIRRYAAEGKLNILKVASADNIADPLTKPMSQIQLDRHMEKMGIRYMGRWL